MEFGNRLREERLRLHLSQEKFGAIAGLRKSTVIRYESEQSFPDLKALEAWKAAGLDPIYVMCGRRTDDLLHSDFTGHRVGEIVKKYRIDPMTSGLGLKDREVSGGLPRVAAGSPAVELIEYLALTEEFTRMQRIPVESLVIVGVHGSSMSPTLEDGDQVIVDRSVNRLFADDVYAIRHGGDVKVRRLQRRADGGVLIISDNKSLPSEELPAEKMDRMVEIIGRVLPYKFGRIKL